MTLNELITEVKKACPYDDPEIAIEIDYVRATIGTVELHTGGDGCIVMLSANDIEPPEIDQHEERWRN
jgi:hypothetical protein